MNRSSVEDSHHALATLNHGIVESLGFSDFDVEVEQSVQAPRDAGKEPASSTEFPARREPEADLLCDGVGVVIHDAAGS